MLGALETTGSPDHAKDHIPFLSHYTSKTEFLCYVLLYLVKMPFPPVSRPRSLHSTGKEKLSGPSPVIPIKTVEEKSSAKERLKKLSKKASPHKSKLPTSRATSGVRMEGKSTWIMTSRPTDPSSSSTPTSSKSTSDISTSGSNLATTSKKMFPASVSATSIPTDSCSPQASSGSSQGLNSKSNFSLNLTPEATLLLQKRSREKLLRGSAGTAPAPHQKSRLPTKSGSRSNIPLVKISLLNDRHRYDDVEYEEDKEQSVDQSVLLKCSEWLQGVENAAGATVLGGTDKISQKSI
ncbi:proline-rich protein 18 [Rhinichthys klamathensis goyatoka]|uniref:proline-rich protein 18 n=1 Tax=Rhinichthys klamathensis goyatoka TaxID=3034132 RepID=UPI0024B4AFA7|nr:proline-rich protein 18 [Rhinichthys klamathensis goyatoka]